MFYALPPALKAGPDWLLILLVAGFASPGVFLPHLRQKRSVQVAGHLAVATTTVAMIGSLYLLVSRLPLHQESPSDLLRAAAALWIGNILVF